MKTLEVVNLQDESEKKIIVMETRLYFFNFADFGEYSIQISRDENFEVIGGQCQEIKGKKVQK